jgi:hypothetical protein
MIMASRAIELALAAFLLSCFAAGATAQQSSQPQDLPTLSRAVHPALYPEVMCVHCVVPQWDRGYILHLETIMTLPWSPCTTGMERKSSKRAWRRRMLSRSFSLLQQPRTPAGFLQLAEGSDGSIQRFIAKADLTGRIVQSLHTSRYLPRQVPLFRLRQNVALRVRIATDATYSFLMLLPNFLSSVAARSIAQQAVGLIRPNKWNLGRRIAVLIVITWLPLLVLTALLNSQGWDSLLKDYRVHARLFIAVPVLLFGELLMEVRFRSLGEVTDLVVQNQTRQGMGPAFRFQVVGNV